jgi:1-acyl-sn-glycerol-3-phosphate acyltransferase
MEKFLHLMAWSLQKITYALYIKIRYRVKTTWESAKPKTNYLLIANHACFYDPWMIGFPSPKPVCYMTNEEGIKKGASKVMGWMTGSFPKKKAQFDLGAVKETITRLKSGRVVGIFPEGDRSWDGETAPIFFNIVKLIRKGKVPLLMARISGNYLTRARWVEIPRVGQVKVHFKLVSTEAIGQLSDEALHNMVSEYLYNNDIKFQRKKEIAFKGKNLAHQIEQVLWLCPRCKAHDCIFGKGDQIFCKACNATWNINGNMVLDQTEPFGDDLKDWMDWQKQQIHELWEFGKPSQILTKSENFILRESMGEDEYREVAKGRLELTKEEMRFIPYDKSDQVLYFDVSTIQHIMIEYFGTLDFVHAEKRYQFEFSNQNAIKWIYWVTTIQAIEGSKERK